MKTSSVFCNWQCRTLVAIIFQFIVMKSVAASTGCNDEENSFVRSRRSTEEDAQTKNQKLNKDHVKIPADYNRYEAPPLIDKTPITVLLAVWIKNIFAIDERKQDFTVEMNIEISWNDSRLQFIEDQNPTLDYNILSPQALDDIWHPDIVVDRAKLIKQSSLTSKPPMFLRMYPDGTLTISSRYTFVIDCQMDFFYYPADTQGCDINFFSYEYPAKIIAFQWKNSKSLNQERSGLSNFDISLQNPRTFTRTGSGGDKHAGLSFTVVLQQQLSFHLIQTYLPSVLLIAISWLSFLMPAEALSEKMTLCMMVLLAVTTMFNSVRHHTPNLSYITAMDIWMIACILFILFTLVHNSLVLFFKTNSIKRKKRHILHPAKVSTSRFPNDPVTVTTQSHKISVETLNPSPRSVTEAKFEPLTDRGDEDNGLGASTLEIVTAAMIPSLFILFNAVYWYWLIKGSNYRYWV